ncbi:hypothetical protein K3495_g9416 [Podosphaera aphanis]|nr:hypothetical protein K3495_g9416 [Podosphaera aphanis]
MTGEDAVPTEDPRNTTELLADRLNAWKFAVDQLGEYFSATEKMERAQAKEYEKILRTIQTPLKSGHHFDQSVGGVASLFENMRQNTQALMNMHLESEKSIKDNVLPKMEQLCREIKNKTKEVATGALKSIKEVEKARNLTQRHIELLGQNAAGFDASGCRLNSHEDPYVLCRGVLYRLKKQVFEENNHRNELVGLQNNFRQYEQHIVEVIQESMSALNQTMIAQSHRHQELYSDMVGTALATPLDFEWRGFIARSGDSLVDPNMPERNIDAIPFPNQNHRATKPIIDGILERKSRNKLSFAGYTEGYYVVTPSRFFHEFKDDDNSRKDPIPELSIYLPDSSISPPNGEKFSVKGKDVSKGFGSKLTGTPEIQFKASSSTEAQRWFKALHGANSNVPYNPITNDFSEQIIHDEEKISTSASPPPTYREDSSITTSSVLLEKQSEPAKTSGDTSEDSHVADTLEEKSPSLKTSGNTPDESPAIDTQKASPEPLPEKNITSNENSTISVKPPVASISADTVAPESKE